MGQKKLLRFEAIRSFPNVLQYPDGIAGKWKDFFKNNHQLTLELACGRGEYTVQLAMNHPGRNFIGVDLKGNRLYIGAKKCLEENIRNAAFLRIQIASIETYFQKDEVSDIWITFPDPQLRNSKAKKRLTHPRFLRLYQQFLIPNGNIHLKTDSPDLFYFTKMVIEMYGLVLHEAYDDVYAANDIHPDLRISTHYESLDIANSNKIHYIRFSLPSSGVPEMDEVLQERLYNHEKIN